MGIYDQINFQQTFIAAEHSFDLNVTNRTLTPSGVFVISGAAFWPDVINGVLTLTSSVTTTYDLCAVIVGAVAWGYAIYPVGTAPVGVGITYLGTVIDYPAINGCVVLLAPRYAFNSTQYVQIESDGVHIKPFGSTAVSPYGQLIIDSPTGINNLKIYTDDSNSFLQPPKSLQINGGTNLTIASGNNGPGTLFILTNDVTSDILISAARDTRIRAQASSGLIVIGDGHGAGVTINPATGGVTVNPTVGGVTVNPVAGGVTIAPTSGDINLNTGKLKTNVASPAGLTQEGWTAPTLVNSWVAAGGAYAIPNYMKDSQGMVNCRGQVKNGTVGAAIFTAGAGYLPSSQAWMANVSNGAFGSVLVSTAGVVTAQSGSNVQFGVDNIGWPTF